MKRSLFKILTIIVCIVTMLNIVLPNITYVVYADNTTNTATTEAQKEEVKATEEYESWLGGLVDGVAGLLTWPLRLLILSFGYVIRLIVGGVASIAGGEFNINISPQDILFDKLEITDVNFFNFDNSLSEGVLTIRKNIAIWYYALRNLAIGILLAILIYVGIRMAISTVASDEAKYKVMLKDWLVSFILVFLMQYIIAFTLNANNALVNIMEKAMGESTDNSIFSDVVDTFALQGADPFSFTMGFGSAVAFCILVGVTLSFLIFYIKRMLTLAFLVIISPIVTVTYAIDKMGDNQSQALNKWVKEFVYTVLIQPFQCLIYIVFATTALTLMQDKTLGAAILGCIMLLFIHQAEHIVRGIFSFEHAHNLGDTFMTLALMKSLGSSLGKIGKAAASGGGGSGAGRGAGAAPSTGGTQTPSQNNQARNQEKMDKKINKGFKKGAKQPSAFSRAKANAAKLANTPAGRILTAAPKASIKAATRFAAPIAFAAMGAGSAGLNGSIIGYQMGQGVYTAGKSARVAAQRKANIKTAERAQLGSNYNSFVESRGLQNNPELAKTQFEAIARDVLKGREVNDFRDEDQQLAQSLTQFKTSFEQMGASTKNIAKDMERTMMKMQELQARQNGTGGGNA